MPVQVGVQSQLRAYRPWPACSLVRMWLSAHETQAEPRRGACVASAACERATSTAAAAPARRGPPPCRPRWREPRASRRAAPCWSLRTHTHARRVARASGGVWRRRASRVQLFLLRKRSARASSRRGGVLAGVTDARITASRQGLDAVGAVTLRNPVCPMSTEAGEVKNRIRLV
eukprot:5950363-Pleurochrysis_carterae.AAC.1